MSDQKIRVYTFLSGDLLTKLDEFAASKGVSRSEAVRIAIDEHLTKKEGGGKGELTTNLTAASQELTSLKGDITAKELELTTLKGEVHHLKEMIKAADSELDQLKPQVDQARSERDLIIKDRDQRIKDGESYPKSEAN